MFIFLIFFVVWVITGMCYAVWNLGRQSNMGRKYLSTPPAGVVGMADNVWIFCGDVPFRHIESVFICPRLWGDIWKNKIRDGLRCFTY